MLIKREKARNMRLARNLTQEALAAQCGLSPRTIQRVERDGVASSDTVSAYCAVFAVSPDDLLLTEAQENIQGISASMVPILFGILFGFSLGLIFAGLLFN